jgi:ketosteroid isomerase-like protein
METTQFDRIRFTLLVILLLFFAGCEQKPTEKELLAAVDISTLEKEIEARLREYENHLKNGDSTALGNMYMEDAEIIPSTIGRDNITKAFGSMIRGGTTGSTFKTTHLWGNDQLLVEDGTGTWSHTDGTVVGSGRYLLVWKKDKGEWKILRDTWFPDRKKQ